MNIKSKLKTDFGEAFKNCRDQVYQMYVWAVQHGKKRVCRQLMLQIMSRLELEHTSLSQAE